MRTLATSAIKPKPAPPGGFRHSRAGSLSVRAGAHRLSPWCSPAAPASERGGIETDDDVDDVIALMRLNHERVVERHGLPGLTGRRPRGALLAPRGRAAMSSRGTHARRLAWRRIRRRGLALRHRVDGSGADQVTPPERPERRDREQSGEPEHDCRRTGLERLAGDEGDVVEGRDGEQPARRLQ
jgi:hypothetical protein